MNTEIILGIGMFTAIVLALAAFIIAARSKLVSSGDVTIDINGEKKITVPAGGKLLQTLAETGLFLPSACGGGGTCAQCRCIVKEGGGSMLPTEESHFTKRERAARMKTASASTMAVNITMPRMISVNMSELRP